MKTLYGILICLFAFNFTKANMTIVVKQYPSDEFVGYEILGLRNSLYRLDSIIDNVVSVAISNFYNRSGQEMIKPITVVSDARYLELVDIKTDYVIRFYLFNNILKAGPKYIENFFESPTLQNKKIVLVPTFSYVNKNGDLITGLPDKSQFEEVRKTVKIKYYCFTDIDHEIMSFQNQNLTPEKSLSVITKYSDNEYLKHCVYDYKFLNSAW